MAERKARASTAGDGGKTAVGPCRREREYETNAELETAVNAYFQGVDQEAETQGGSGRYDEFGLALHLGVNRRTLVHWAEDDGDPERRFLVNQAYDRIAHQLISGAPWNDKFTTQKSMKMMEQERFGGYNARSSVRSDTKIRVSFGEGADEECMR